MFNPSALILEGFELSFSLILIVGFSAWSIGQLLKFMKLFFNKY